MIRIAKLLLLSAFISVEAVNARRLGDPHREQHATAARKLSSEDFPEIAPYVPPTENDEEPSSVVQPVFLPNANQEATPNVVTHENDGDYPLTLPNQEVPHAPYPNPVPHSGEIVKPVPPPPPGEPVKPLPVPPTTNENADGGDYPLTLPNQEAPVPYPTNPVKPLPQPHSNEGDYPVTLPNQEEPQKPVPYPTDPVKPLPEQRPPVMPYSATTTGNAPVKPVPPPPEAVKPLPEKPEAVQPPPEEQDVVMPHSTTTTGGDPLPEPDVPVILPYSATTSSGGVIQPLVDESEQEDGSIISTTEPIVILPYSTTTGGDAVKPLPDDQTEGSTSSEAFAVGNVGNAAGEDAAVDSQDDPNDSADDSSGAAVWSAAWLGGVTTLAFLSFV